MEVSWWLLSELFVAKKKVLDRITQILWNLVAVVKNGNVVDVLMFCIHFEFICTICEFSMKFAMNRCGPETKVMNIP